MLAWLQRWLSRLTVLAAIIGGAAVAGLMALTVVAVFWRYGLNDPIFGLEDLSTLTLSVVVAASVAYAASRQAHVSVDLLGHLRLGRKLSRVIDAIAQSLSLAMVALAGYALFSKGSCGLPCGAVTNNLSIVQTPFYYALGVAMWFYALSLALTLLSGFASTTRFAAGRKPGNN